MWTGFVLMNCFDLACTCVIHEVSETHIDVSDGGLSGRHFELKAKKQLQLYLFVSLTVFSFYPNDTSSQRQGEG